MRFWMSLFNLGNSGDVGSLLWRSSCLIIMSSISVGTGSSWSLWCYAALSRTVQKISTFWQSVGRAFAHGLYFLSVSGPVRFRLT